MGFVSINALEKEKAEGQKKAVIAVDFDGTIVEHEFPAIGRDNPGAVEVLRELMAKGYRLILNTIRTDQHLDEAIRYCNSKKIDFWAVNNNPEQESWNSSRKIYANFYIDDAALGVPLAKSTGTSTRPRVDWTRVRQILVDWEILDPIETEADPLQPKHVGDIQ